MNLPGVFEWIEGSRTFDLTWGLVCGALCLALEVPVLRWALPALLGSRVVWLALHPDRRVGASAA